MGLLVDGVWKDQWYDTKKSGGKFVRSDAGFRNWVTEDGSAGPTGESGFKAETGRYHLYISHACPWANRAAIFRKLKGLESMIDVSVVDHFMGSEGWTFDEAKDDPEDTRDQLGGRSRMHQVYTAAKADYTGRVTVPVLWDKERETIVSNESSEIIRMFNSAFNAVGATGPDLYPDPLREEIDSVNERVYHTVNNGVYKCGFATTQEAYQEAFQPMFETLDWLEDRLAKQQWLVGDQVTEADWRLFTTLVRFDPVYVGHFKCNRNRIADFPNLSNYTRALYQWPGVADTINIDHIKSHYYGSHETINPTRIVPVGPDIDFMAPHDRGRFD
ncbi:MAG: glutathione S-transferase family protein [Pseudomonadota bacterium]